ISVPALSAAAIGASRERDRPAGRTDRRRAALPRVKQYLVTSITSRLCRASGTDTAKQLACCVYFLPGLPAGAEGHTARLPADDGTHTGRAGRLRGPVAPEQAVDHH